MADLRVRVAGDQMVENRLVGNFAGQTHIAWRHRLRRRAHQCSPPMRRRAGNAGDPVLAEPNEEVADWFFASDSTNEPPSRMARRKICKPP